MLRSTFFRALAALPLAWALTAAVSTAAPATKEEPRPRKESPAEILRKALNLTVSLELNEQPLATALAQIAEQNKVNIVLDRTFIGNMGIDPDSTNINLKVKDVKLRTALRALLTPHNLGFAVVGDMILVSTEENALHRQMRQRIRVDYEGVPLNKALRELAREYAVNILIDPRQAKKASDAVSLQLDDVPLETAVRLMSEMAGLKPVKMANVLFVTSEERADKLKDSDNPQPSLPAILNGLGGAVGIDGIGGIVVPGVAPVPRAPVPVAPPAGGGAVPDALK